MPESGWSTTPSAEKPNQLFIIDWEMVQFGHRSYDLGQLIGDLYERKLFRGRDVVTPVIEAVIGGYGAVGRDMAFRTAIYVGVHLITWYQRRPKKGPAAEISRETVLEGLAVGRDFIIKGWENDAQFFMETCLAPLFA